MTTSYSPAYGVLVMCSSLPALGNLLCSDWRISFSPAYADGACTDGSRNIRSSAKIVLAKFIWFVFIGIVCRLIEGVLHQQLLERRDAVGYIQAGIAQCAQQWIVVVEQVFQAVSGRLHRVDVF